MKLSQAMKAGAEQTAPGTGDYYAGMQGNRPMACALGAAWVGVHGVRGLEECGYARLVETWPELRDTYDYPEGTRVGGGDLWNLVTNLNDAHAWTREQIADWLAEKGL